MFHVEHSGNVYAALQQNGFHVEHPPVFSDQQISCIIASLRAGFKINDSST